MLNAKSFLAADFGAATLKVAEFEPNEAGGLRLRQYGFRALGQEGLQESTRESALLKAFQDLLANGGFESKQVNVCAPGFHVFSKFVKLPPVDTSKVTQIIQYEAQQNVPFPLEEVVWDYQILGAAATGELEVLLVAIKADIVEGLFRTSDAAGTKLSLVDVSPAALANAFRYNYGDLEGCSMLLDIGAKTSNLLFFDKENVYARGINIGANSITVDFAKESKLPWDQAETTKIDQGFVSLGGAYEEPEDPHQQAISKISRQVMTRLHIQVNQTIQFYRGQQGGAAPVRLFLSGGASTLPYTAQFFAEKLNLPVEYFNPLRNVQIDPAVNIEELAKVGHQMGELVGLGLRNLAHCPIELNLMPKSSLQVQQFSAKKPYLIATMACLVAILFAFGYFNDRIATAKRGSLEKLQQQLAPLQGLDTKVKAEDKKVRGAHGEAMQLADWLEDRSYWGALLMELRNVMIKTERDGRQMLKEKFKTDAPTGIWIEQFQPDCAGTHGAPDAQGVPAAGGPGAPGGPNTPPGAGPGPARPRRGGPGGGRGGGPGGGNPMTFAAGREDICQTINVLCRGVDLTHVAPNAASDFVYLLDQNLKASSMLHTNSSIVGDLKPDDAAFGVKTFTIQVVVAPKRPLKL
jgi:type IV pilus assembly protein PilM